MKKNKDAKVYVGTGDYKTLLDGVCSMHKPFSFLYPPRR